MDASTLLRFRVLVAATHGPISVEVGELKELLDEYDRATKLEDVLYSIVVNGTVGGSDEDRAVALIPSLTERERQ